MKKRISYDKAAHIVLVLIVCALALSLIGVMFTVEGDILRAYLMLGSLVCLIAGVWFGFVYCRCPSCGKRIIMGMLKVKVCPNCHRDLNTGEKVKGKKAKR